MEKIETKKRGKKRKERSYKTEKQNKNEKNTHGLFSRKKKARKMIKKTFETEDSNKTNSIDEIDNLDDSDILDEITDEETEPYQITDISKHFEVNNCKCVLCDNTNTNKHLNYKDNIVKGVNKIWEDNKLDMDQALKKVTKYYNENIKVLNNLVSKPNEGTTNGENNYTPFPEMTVNDFCNHFNNSKNIQNIRYNDLNYLNNLMKHIYNNELFLKSSKKGSDFIKTDDDAFNKFIKIVQTKSVIIKNLLSVPVNKKGSK